MSLTELFGEAISAYSRATAIADGFLIDVTQAAAARGFKVPVALTRAVYADCVQWTDADTERKKLYQEEAGRLADVLSMALIAIRTSHRDAERVVFRVSRVPNAGKARDAQTIKLAMTIGPGDDFEPVITIMQPEED